MEITNCDNDTELTILAKNLTDLEEGDLLTYTIVDPLDLGSISACGNALSEYFIIELDGVTTTFIDVGITIYGPDSTWLYAYGDVNMTDSNVNLGMDDIPAVGTYPGDLVQNANMFLLEVVELIILCNVVALADSLKSILRLSEM